MTVPPAPRTGPGGEGSPRGPSLRRPLGVLALLVFILAYVLLVTWAFAAITTLHPLLQAPLWLLLGLAWILPVRPFLVWMETGRWRARR
jgi:hypothetical protein